MTAQLALGTVQFGLAYGVAGRREQVPAGEAREILARAWAAGIRVLDTAPDYGNIEERLSALVGTHGFTIVSKIPRLNAANHEDVRSVVATSVARSIARLGPRLRVLLFHRGEDLLERAGEAAWEAAVGAARGDIEIGASCYSPDEAVAIRHKFGVTTIQLPANALDQRLAKDSVTEVLAEVDIHIRSMFLQGLLLMPLERAIKRVPQAAQALRKWHDWCRLEQLAPLSAAIAVAKGLPRINYCLFGVDSLPQFEEVVTAWHATPALLAPTLASADANTFDPRRWPV